MTKEKYEEIVAYLRSVISGTKWEGKVYTVGGCLRDALMGHDIHDVDLAVNVPDGGVLFPLWLEKRGLTLVPPTLYRRFSSSRLRLKAFPDDEIEVVQTRREQYTDENSRNPEVCFGSIMDDCERRDLTINSLYQNVSTGEMLDLTGCGVDDIRNHRIRTPMAPDDTYSDDPIRIMRTLRFAVRYGWEISDEIFDAMKENASRMKIVRRPRVSTEFEKMMLSNDPVRLLQLMKEIGVIFRVLPELCHLYRLKDQSLRGVLGANAPLPSLWDVTLERLAEVVGSPGDSLEARFAALFSQFHRVRIPYSYHSDKEKQNRRGRGRSAVVATALRRLMYDHDFVRRVKNLLPEIPSQTDTDNVLPAPKVRKKRSSQSAPAPAASNRKKRWRRRRRNASKSGENPAQ